MTGISASLESDYDIIVFRKKVYHTAFAFISPVDPHDRAI
jgi:hypothetical protein